MRRTEQVQGLRLMKFEEVYGRTHRGGLSQAECGQAGSGVSRSAPSGAGATATRRREPTVSGDRRLGRDPGAASRRWTRWSAGAGVACRHRATGTVDGQALPREAGGRSRLQAQLRTGCELSLQAHGRRRAAPRRGSAPSAQRLQRSCPARHDVARQDELEPRVGPRSTWWDLIVTMDDADQRYLLGLLRRRRGDYHVELPGGVRGDPGNEGPVLLRSDADRASHYWNTPEAGGKVDKDTSGDPGRPRRQWRILPCGHATLIPAYSPEVF